MKKIILITIVSTILSSCKKEEIKQPKETETVSVQVDVIYDDNQVISSDVSNIKN